MEVVEGTRLAVAAMTTGPAARGGAIVNVASAGGVFPMSFAPAYAVAKAGVVMLCRSLDHLEHGTPHAVAVRANPHQGRRWLLRPCAPSFFLSSPQCLGG